MTTRIRQMTGNSLTFLSALVPVFKSCPPCPICMPKYAAMFAFFGLEMSDYSQYLAPVMLLGIAMTILSMHHHCRVKNISRYPFFSSCVFSVLLLVAKFVYDNEWAIYSSMAGLFVSLILHYYAMGTSSCSDGVCKDSSRCQSKISS